MEHGFKDGDAARSIWPLEWNPEGNERIIVGQEAIGLGGDEWLARKAILTEKARLWVVNEANKERAVGNWSEADYAFFKKEMRTMEPTPLRDIRKGDRIISTRCEKGGYSLNYLLDGGWITGFSNHSST